MCMNGVLVVMAFGPLFGLWPSSFFLLLRDHGPRYFMLQNWSKTCKTTNIRAEVRMVSDSDIKFMPLSKLNR